MTADIAELWRNGDVETLLDRYAPPQYREEFAKSFQRLMAEPDSSRLPRLKALAHAFDALDNRLPTMDATGTRAEYTDDTLYGGVMPPGADKIPIVFQKIDGHWYLTNFGLLYIALYNIPLARYN